MTIVTKDQAEQLAADLGDFRASADSQLAAVVNRAIAFAELVATEKAGVPSAGFRVSLTGLIGKAAQCCDRGQAFTLREMLKHLAELKSRRLEGTRVIDEFFALYAIED